MLRTTIISAMLAASWLASGASAPVQFVVLTPDGAADQPAQIYLASSADDWDGLGRPLARVASGLYSGVWDLLPGCLEYKFTREGRWDSVEKSAEGYEISNRVLEIGPAATELVVVHHVAAWADRKSPASRRVEFVRATSQAAVKPLAHTVTGDVRTHPDFASPQLNNTRTVLVWLPPDYDGSPDERYPVLYLHDAQNVFDVATSSNGAEWQADETATRLIRSGQLLPFIMVAIANTPDRMNEYPPFRDERHGGGRGEAYTDFVIDTVKPFIDRTYRTRPGPDDTAMAGSSLGGLVSLYAACRRPDVFGSAAAISPSLFWADRAMLRYVREHPPSPRARLWIDIGTAEGRRAQTQPSGSQPAITELMADCRKLVRVLVEQGYRPETDLHYEEVADANHNERFWAARLDRVLLFLFSNRPQRDGADLPPDGSRHPTAIRSPLKKTSEVVQ